LPNWHTSQLANSFGSYQLRWSVWQYTLFSAKIPKMANSDFYEILGVEKGATDQEIKKAFRKKAAHFHPDKNKDPKATEEFKKINEAYQVLSDPQKRQMYDQYGNAAFNQGGGGGFGGNGQGFEFDFSDIFGGGAESIFGDESPFGDLFGRSRSRQKVNKGNDISLRVKVTLDDVLHGPEKEIKYNRKEKCKACKGLGGAKVETCNTCRGAGKVAQMNRTFFGTVQVQRECPDCKGTGKRILEKCGVCKGESVVDGTRTFKIKIPQGIESGMSLRFRDEGDAGKFESESGDLYVEIDVQSHATLKRNGDNLNLNIHLPIYSLVLGDEIQISTLDGDKKVKIPAGLEINEKLVLRNLGLPRFRTDQRGDLVLNINVEVPKNLNKQEKELYEKLRDLNKGKGKGFWR
jgi:molecular chaperone DnaJ